MDLKSMKIQKKNMMMMGDEVVSDVGFSNKGLQEQEKPEYPYCLKLYLGSEELAKLGISELPALSSVIHLAAKAVVVSLRNDHENKTMELQITDMALVPQKKEKSPAEALYSASEEMAEEKAEG